MASYNGTITVGSGDGAYGFIRSGNVFGDTPMGSVSVDAGSPQVDEFYWTADGSVLYIMLVGNHSGVVNFNGNEYAFVYSGTYDVSEYNGVGLGGPYPTNGTVNFTYDDPAPASTYTLAASTYDADLSPQAAVLLRTHRMQAQVYDFAVAFGDAALVGSETRILAAETRDFALTKVDAGLSSARAVFAQSRLFGVADIAGANLQVSSRALTASTYDVAIAKVSATLTYTPSSAYSISAEPREFDLSPQAANLNYVSSGFGYSRAPVSIIIT